MPEFTDSEFRVLVGLWIEAYVRLKKLGEILLKKQPVQSGYNEKMAIGEMELGIVKKDKDGNIVHTQKIRSTGKGKILEHKRWDKDGSS